MKGAQAMRIARVLLSSQYAYMLEYRAEIALWALSGVVPFIMLALWSQVDTGAAGAQALGLNRLELGRYFLSAFIVRQFTIAWVVWAFEEDALQGRLSHALLQPLHPLWRYLSAHLAEQATHFGSGPDGAAGDLDGFCDPFSVAKRHCHSLLLE